jgi:hypothetical protein
MPIGIRRRPVTKRYVNIADFVKTGRVPEGAMSPLDQAEVIEKLRWAKRTCILGKLTGRA